MIALTKQQNKQKILDTSKALFYASGYSAITMDDIARKLGMSKKTLYKYYSGKYEIMCQIIRNLKDELAGGVNKIVNNESTAYPEKLRQMLNFVGFTLANISPALLEDLQKNLPALWEELNRHKRESAYLRFNKLIEEGRRKGFINEGVNHRLIVALYASAVQNLLDPAFLNQLPEEILEDLPQSPGVIFDNLVNIIFEGILNADAKEKFKLLK